METQEQARLLTDPASVKFFKPFLAATRSMGEVAAELGCPINTLHYRVTRFLEAGLLAVVKEQKRKGRAVKHYRSVGNSVFVPFLLTPYATLQEGIAEQLRPVWRDIQAGLADLYSRQEAQGRKLYRDERGVVLTSLNAAPGDVGGFESLPDTDTFYSDLSLALTKEEATALNKRLLALFLETYEATAARKGGEVKYYLFQAALVPQEGWA